MEQLINDSYKGSTINRIIVRASLQKKAGFTYLIQSLFYLLILVAKLIFAKLYRDNKEINPSQKVFISWSPLHSKMARTFDKQLKTKEYYYQAFSLEQIRLFKSISLRKCLRLAFKINFTDHLQHANGFDNFFVRLAFVIEFYLLDNLLKNREEVIISGHYDRYAVIISELCAVKRISLSLIQHGSLSSLKGFHKLQLDRVYYLFDFSIPFFSNFVAHSETVKFLPCPNLEKNLAFSNNPELSVGAVAFACQDYRPENNYKIIDILRNYYPEVVVYPHPRESIEGYKKRYGNNSNVIISYEKFSNITKLFTRFSTLGVEYAQLDVESVFVNIDKLNNDIVKSGKFKSFTDLESFINYLEETVGVKNES